MFLDNPLLGVGPGCYGFKLQSYVTRASAEEWGVRYQMYGRALHNIYFELLAETGIMGITAFLVLLYIFRRRNVSIRKTAARLVSIKARVATDALGNVHCYALALEGAMIAFLANGFFYNLLYYSWFWDILILNTLLYQRVRTIEHAAIDER
jgi:O-antigen ligase